MKNFLTTLAACIISSALTFYILDRCVEATKEKTKTQENKDVDNISSDDNLGENPEEKEGKEKITTVLNVDPINIEKDFTVWKTYNDENIDLSNEFTAINTDNTKIEKEDFLTKLKTGLYIPIKGKSEKILYQLYKLSNVADLKIGKNIRSSASSALTYLLKEGKPFPVFNFSDLDGQKYTSENMKGKIKVIECWCISCVVCVKEFSNLNKIYDEYESNEKVVFFSLAFDKAKNLKKFLGKQEFRFPVIADQKEFIKTLQIKQYPVHIILDENNNFIKTVNKIEKLSAIIKSLTTNKRVELDGKEDEGIENFNDIGENELEEEIE